MTQLFHFISPSSLLPFPPCLIRLPRHMLLPADPGIGGAQRQKRARLADDVTEKIQLRPGPLVLHNKNILPLENCECHSPPLSPTTEHRHANNKQSATEYNHMQHNVSQSKAMQHNSMQISAQLNANKCTTQCKLVQCIALTCIRTHHTMQCNTTQYNVNQRGVADTMPRR